MDRGKPTFFIFDNSYSEIDLSSTTKGIVVLMLALLSPIMLISTLYDLVICLTTSLLALYMAVVAIFHFLIVSVLKQKELAF